MSAPVIVVLAVLAILFVAAAIDVVKLYRRRLAEERAREDVSLRVQQRIAEVAQLRPPDELARARELTKADRRRMTVPQPRPRKRRTGRWG